MNAQMPSNPAYELSSGEYLIRQYRCAKVKAGMGAKTDAFLDITNKRVIYSSDRLERSPKSKVLGEMPLQEVSGIELSIAESFAFPRFLLFFLLAYLLTSLLAELIPFMFDSLIFGLLLCLPYLVSLLFDRQLLNPELKNRFKEQLSQSDVGAWTQKNQGLPWDKIFKTLFLVGASILIYKLGESDVFSGLGSVLKYPLIFLAYLMLYLLAFPRGKEFNRSIHSRSAGPSSITISNSLFSRLGETVDAGKQGTLDPGEDAEKLSRELGALVMDLQQMGDLGAEKWQSR